MWQGLDVLVVWFRVVVWSWWLLREEAVFVCWSYFGLEQQLPPQQRQQQGLRPFLSIRSTLLFSPSFMTIESNTIFVFSFLGWRLPKTISNASLNIPSNDNVMEVGVHKISYCILFYLVNILWFSSCLLAYFYDFHYALKVMV